MMAYSGCLELAEKAFSYDVKKATANGIVYSTNENAFSAGSRYPAWCFICQPWE
jgi:hypothetical protein